MSKDYLPHNDVEFSNWFNNLINYVVRKTTGTPPEWDHIPKRYVDELDAAYADWIAHYKPTLQPHTPAQTAAKNDSRRRAEKVIRPFVNRFLHFEPVTTEDRVNMALPLHDNTRTDHLVVLEEVECNLVIEGIRVVHVHFKVLGADGKAKPEGYEGAVIQWAVGNAPFTRIEDLRDGNEMVSRTPHTLHFTDDQRGKTVSVALCWHRTSAARGGGGVRFSQLSFPRE